MGLKNDRVIYEDRMDTYVNEAVARGKLVVLSTAASGTALDDNTQLGTVTASPSGAVVLGVTLGDMVDIDATRQFLNTQQDQTLKGGKMQLLTEGWIVTDNVEAGTIAAGEAAYIGQSGLFANAAALASYGYTPAATDKVGRFETTADQNGYHKITVDIQ